MSLGSSFNYPPQYDGEPRYASSGITDNYPPPYFDEPGDEPRNGINMDDREPSYAINGKSLISAIILLLFVVLLLFLLHVYASWFWRQFRRDRRRSASIRHRFHFTGEEPARLLNVGLDSAVLETLPIFLYKSQHYAAELECAVCLCEFEENEKARLLPNCRHSFHVECIDMWFRSHSNCPVCRTGAQLEQPVLESVRIEQISATIPGPSPSRIHENLNSEQGQTAVYGEE